MTPICHRLLIEASATAWGAAQVACRVGALAFIAGAAQAGDWPTRPITAVVPYAAGGNTDTMARIASERLTAVLGQPVIVENVAGASGAIGATRVAQAAPDGNTLLFASASQIIIAPLVQKTHYDPQKDFVPVSIVGAGPYILGVKASLPANTFQEFIAYARNNPGKLNYASAGPGGIIHLTTALLASRAGIQMTHVPYKSGAPALNGLLTGEVDLYFGNASELLQQAASGRVRLLAVSSAARLKQLPDCRRSASSIPAFSSPRGTGFLLPPERRSRSCGCWRGRRATRRRTLRLPIVCSSSVSSRAATIRRNSQRSSASSATSTAPLRPPPASRWNSPAAAHRVEVAALLGDTARAILAALLDGQ
ncbi:MAG: tripartite tricarboxylate transporter substrate binding protein [Xanthobacteraceae bacterium]